MNTLIKNVVKTTRATKMLTLLIVAVLTWPGAASAQGAKAIEGTWEVIATIRDCASGNVIRPVPRMITFAKGGTLSEYTAAGTEGMPVARSPGFGSWEYLDHASFTYSLKFMRLTAFGGQDGSISETRILDVNKSGDKFTADGSGFITLANGVKIPTCTTEEGWRLY